MKRLILAAGVVSLLAVGAGITYFFSPHPLLSPQAQELQSVAQAREEQLLGYTAYSRYATAGKTALIGHNQLLTAKITREEGMTEVIERSLLPGLASNATIALWYQVEYAFGYDLEKEAFDLLATAQGLEMVLSPPRLLTTPSVSKLTHRVLSGGWLTDEKLATIRLQQQAAGWAQKNGEKLAKDPAVMALCEKKLTEFMHGFLSRQPGVKIVPHITIRYR